VRKADGVLGRLHGGATGVASGMVARAGALALAMLAATALAAEPTGADASRSFAGRGAYGDVGCGAADFIIALAGADLGNHTWYWQAAFADRTPTLACIGAVPNQFLGAWDPAIGGCLNDGGYVLLCLRNPQPAPGLARDLAATQYDLLLCGSAGCHVKGPFVAHWLA
jgi:hypothetical protein